MPDFSRRRILQSLGVSTLGATTGIVSAKHGGTRQKSIRKSKHKVRQIKGNGAHQIIGEMMSDPDVKKVLKKVRDKGLIPKVGHAVAKELTVEKRNIEREGVMVPLKNKNMVWNTETESKKISSTTGYLIWGRKERTAAFIFGFGKNRKINEGKINFGLNQLFRQSQRILVITPKNTHEESIRNQGSIDNSSNKGEKHE